MRDTLAGAIIHIYIYLFIYPHDKTPLARKRATNLPYLNEAANKSPVPRAEGKKKSKKKKKLRDNKAAEITEGAG